MNYVREYWGRISSGEIVTSRRVKAVYGRLMQEMDAPSDDSAYYFDEETGERPILFIEQFCKQSQGTLGAALKLELFQKAFIQTLFGWLEKDTGYRRFRETLLLVARKNGKTTLLAAIALYLLVADYEGAAEIYSVATKKDQAKKTLTEAVNMVKQSPEPVSYTHLDVYKRQLFILHRWRQRGLTEQKSRRLVGMVARTAIYKAA